ncbi:unnamed protein product [Polarella glacialis]|uniref:Uncharacterized protein n=1 Tax=Polarella glacialis TaxID=89957 RepID=A0A813DIX4_POLGL|nr:unnamed protein product [Polarella glacialis]
MPGLFCPQGTPDAKSQGRRALLPLLVLAAGAVVLLHGRSSGEGAFLSPILAAGRPSLRSGPADSFEQAAFDGLTAQSSSSESSTSTLICGASVVLLLAAGTPARDVAMFGACPKSRRAHYKTRNAKVRWYKLGDRAAARALALGKGIKAGTIDFIYGKPQDEDEAEDDYEDEYDDEDGDDISKKSLA